MAKATSKGDEAQANNQSEANKENQALERVNQAKAVELTGFNNKKAYEDKKRNDEKAAREKAAHEKLERDKAAFRNRMAQQNSIYGQYRFTDQEIQLGGVAGEFIRLARLDPISLGAMAITQYIFFALFALTCQSYREQQVMYNQAKAAGNAYNPKDPNITIYHIGANYEPDFSRPYKPGEEIPTPDIILNGYVPTPDLIAGWRQDFVKFVEQQSGATLIPNDYKIETWGKDKALKMMNIAANHADPTREKAEQLEAQRAMMRKPTSP